MKRPANFLIIILIAALLPINSYANPQEIFPYDSSYNQRSFEAQIAICGTATKVPVLMYHHLLKAKDKKSANSLIVTVEEFERQMKYLYDQHYTTITIRELELFLENKLALPKKSVLITLDDGYKSHYLYAYPILKKYGFKASVALIPKLMPKSTEGFNPARLNYLSWQEVMQGRDVFEYVNHTFSHASMKSISYERALKEIKKADELLKSSYFVYPIGHTSQASERALRKLKYRLAFTTKAGFVTKNSSRLYLPRQRVNGGITVKAFSSLLQ